MKTPPSPSLRERPKWCPARPHRAWRLAHPRSVLQGRAGAVTRPETQVAPGSHDGAKRDKSRRPSIPATRTATPDPAWIDPLLTFVVGGPAESARGLLAYPCSSEGRSPGRAALRGCARATRCDACASSRERAGAVGV